MMQEYLYLEEIMKNRIVFIVVFFVLSLFFGSITGIAITSDEYIAQQYSPILYFEKDETCYPVDVSYYIENSALYVISGVDPELQTDLVSESPSIEDLGNQSSEYQFLDNQLGTTRDNNGIILDYQNNISQLGYTIYSHIYSNGGTTVVQYWMFYVFNKGELNSHEGDWEMVQIVLSDSKPVEVMCSQHYSGQKASWDLVEKEGDHVKIYVALGSHANYFRPYSGKFGLANDVVGDNGKVLKTNDYTLELLESQDWLDFKGRWGEFFTIDSIVLGEAGPYGPQYYGRAFETSKAAWDDPIEWGANLLEVNTYFFLFEWVLYNFIMVFFIATAASICILAFRIFRRHRRYGLGPRILSVLYIDGFNLKSIGNILCIIGIIIAIFGLFNQWYSVSTNVVIPGQTQMNLPNLIFIDGIHGLQMTLPSTTGPTPLGSFMMPFSLIIGIGLVFFVIDTIGVPTSKKLGKKYVLRGIRVALSIIMILVLIVMLGPIINEVVESQAGGNAEISKIFNGISSQPFSGSSAYTIPITENEYATINLEWGLGSGGFLLLIAGIIISISGLIEFAAHSIFFEQKTFEKSNKKEHKKLNEKSKKTLDESRIEKSSSADIEKKKND